MKSSARIILCLVVLFILAACANSTSQSQTLSITDAWARPGVAGGNSAVYFIIENPTSQADSLVSAECNAAEHVELHMTSMDADGNMRMHHQDSVAVEANSQVEFRPGGLHIMLIQLQENLVVGDTIQVTLNFENNGPILVQAPIQQP
jgi:periplasmic copper chaperone A